jgi:glycosyltransferase involved in cell wall biosynthesis
MEIEKRSLRFVHVISSFQLGGAEEIAVDLARAAASDGFSVTVCAVYPPTGIVGWHQIERLKKSGVHCEVLGNSRSLPQLLMAAISLAWLIGKNRPYIVHLHTDIPDFVGSVARRLCSFKVVRTIHNTTLWPNRPRLARFVESSFKGDRVVAVSEAAAHAYIKLRERTKLSPSPYQTVIYNGIDRPILDRGGARNAFGDLIEWDERRLELCFAGRLTRQKGFDVLVNALKLLSRSDIERLRVHVFAPMDGDGMNEILEAAKMLPIRLHNPIPELRELFAAFDALVMPSRYEGFCLVAAEALAAGVPVLASDVTGLAEALPKNWPLKFGSEDASELATLISRFLRRENQLIKKLQSIISIHTFHSKEDMWLSYKHVYLNTDK